MKNENYEVDEFANELGASKQPPIWLFVVIVVCFIPVLLSLFILCKDKTFDGQCHKPKINYEKMQDEPPTCNKKHVHKSDTIHKKKNNDMVEQGAFLMLQNALR